MVPRSESHSSLGLKYPENRDAPNRSADLWIEDKRRHDGADGFWRVHDNLYDLTNFIDIHPGGKLWLELTKGTDITEAFEAHHLSSGPETMLKKFYVRKASTLRHAPYTFKEDGFYKTLKRNAIGELNKLPKRDVNAWKSNLMTDLLALTFFITSVLCCKFWSIWLALFSSVFLALTTTAGHNYFHRKDNFRMYYFDLSMMSSRDWRIMHVLSHHLLPNTVYDLQISLFEPSLEYLPTRKKKYISMILAPVEWMLLFHKSFYSRVKTTEFSKLSTANLIPFIVPAVMYLFGGQSILSTLLMWNIIVFASSFYFGFIGFNVGHHHPDIFHDGDAVRDDMDWGVIQLDTLMDRIELKGSHFLGLVLFGDHALHHIFPTLDHGSLQYLYPTFENTLKQFNIDVRMTTQLELIKGHFQQLMRDKPNGEVPDLLKYSKHK